MKKSKKATRALAFLKGELLRDAYDNGDRFNYLLWNEEEKMSYETAADLEHSQQDQDNTYSKQRSSRNDHAWIEDLDDDEITAMWSEVLSISFLMPK